MVSSKLSLKMSICPLFSFFLDWHGRRNDIGVEIMLELDCLSANIFSYAKKFKVALVDIKNPNRTPNASIMLYKGSVNCKIKK